jgi:hypothetical protein
MVMTRDRPSRWCGIDPELDYQSPGNPRAGALCDYQALCDGRSIIAAPPIASDATAQVLVPGIDDDLAVIAFAFVSNWLTTVFHPFDRRGASGMGQFFYPSGEGHGPITHFSLTSPLAIGLATGQPPRPVC